MRPPTLPPPPRLWWTGKLWRINVPHCVTVGLCPGVVRSLAGQKDKKCHSRFQAEGAGKQTRAQNLPPSVGLPPTPRRRRRAKFEVQCSKSQGRSGRRTAWYRFAAKKFFAEAATKGTQGTKATEERFRTLKYG